MKFKEYLHELSELTTSGDIATVDSKLKHMHRRDKHLVKGKKCKEHKQLNCEECDNSKWG